MNARQRMSIVLAGRKADRPPVSFWHHFPKDQIEGNGAVEAHLRQMERYELDFLKVMADSPYPHDDPIQTPDDLGALQTLKGDEGGFGRQLELLSALRRRLGPDVYIATTVFNAWMVLRLLVEPPRVHNPPNLEAKADRPSQWIRLAMSRDAHRVGEALRIIGENLSRFSSHCISAGADGIFMSVRDDWVDGFQGQQAGESLYDRWVEPADRTILSGVAKAPFNMVHVCGKAVNFARFAAYPSAVLHWADRAAGPSIREAAKIAKPTLAGGVDNLGTLVRGAPDDVKREVRDAIAQAGERPVIIAPGCTFDPTLVPEANLRAMVEAAKE